MEFPEMLDDTRNRCADNNKTRGQRSGNTIPDIAEDVSNSQGINLLYQTIVQLTAENQLLRGENNHLRAELTRLRDTG